MTSEQEQTKANNKDFKQKQHFGAVLNRYKHYGLTVWVRYAQLRVNTVTLALLSYHILEQLNFETPR